MKPKQILKQAAELLARTGWIKGANARSVSGLRVNANSRMATCFCLFGAVQRVTGGNLVETEEALHLVGLYLGFTDKDMLQKIVHWNDAKERTEAEVFAALEATVNELPSRVK